MRIPTILATLLLAGVSEASDVVVNRCPPEPAVVNRLPREEGVENRCPSEPAPDVPFAYPIHTHTPPTLVPFGRGVYQNCGPTG